MSHDARIMATLPLHPKTRKLIKRHGQAAAWNLVCLFLFACENKSKGILDGMTAEDIELACDWQGDDGAFVATLVDVGFLDLHGDTYEIHDWATHNSWANGKEERSEAARKSAAARWAKRYGSNADASNPQCGSHDSALPSDSFGNAPFLSLPSPSLSNTNPEEHGDKAPPDGGSPKKPLSQGSRIPADWQPDEVLLAWAKAERPDLNLAQTVDSFRDYWIGKSGKDATKTDWPATFRNWVRREKAQPISANPVDSWAGRDI